ARDVGSPAAAGAGLDLDLGVFGDETVEVLVLSARHGVCLPQKTIAPANWGLGQQLAGGVVGDGKVGASIPVLLPPLGVRLDHPSRPDSSQRKSLAEIVDHGRVRQPCRRLRLSYMVDRMIDPVTDDQDTPR